MWRNLWTRTKSFFARLFRRAPPEPGRFEHGSKWSIKGFVPLAPWVLPRREYLVYVPRGHRRWRRTALLVLIHGCRQSAEDIAKGSRIAQLADEIGCLVLLPCQHPRANAWGCWNWFDRRTASGRGEAAIVAAQIRSVRRRYRVDRKRVYVAGLSSGAGLATALALRHSLLVAGIFVHSGVAAGAASSPFTAINVLKHGPDVDVARLATRVRERYGNRARALPVLVLQGARDNIVAPMHAGEIVRQFLAFAGYPGVAGAPAALPDADVTTTTEARATTEPQPAGGVTVREWRMDGRLLVREIVVEALGHAWSGGDPDVPYNDPQPPEATALLRAFMQDIHNERGSPWRLPG